jgi:hypothetical protein
MASTPDARTPDLSAPHVTAQVGCSTRFSKRINEVTIGTHRLGTTLWITSGQAGDKM